MWNTKISVKVKEEPNSEDINEQWNEESDLKYAGIKDIIHKEENIDGN